MSWKVGSADPGPCSPLTPRILRDIWLRVQGGSFSGDRSFDSQVVRGFGWHRRWHPARRQGRASGDPPDVEFLPVEHLFVR